MNYEAFISYRRTNTEVAREIYHALREDRHTAFFDVDSLHAGDFTAEIKAAIRSSELVVALLTCESVQRMAKNPQTDMVRKELRTAQQEERPIQFLWLKEDDGADIYDLLNSYPDDELLHWIAGQNIMAFTADSDDIRRICGKVVETLQDERRKKFERLRGSDLPEAHRKFTVGDRMYTYHGGSRLSKGGAAYPYGEGTLVEEGNLQRTLVYEGTWEGDEDFSGSGTVYLEKKDGTRTVLYRGRWQDLKYSDSDGQLFDPESKECTYQGVFLDGKPLGPLEGSIFHMELYAPEDTEKKQPLYSGSAQTGPDSYHGELRKCLYGEEYLDGETLFQGWYDEKGEPSLGELRFPNGDVYSGGVGRQTEYNGGRRSFIYGPTGFGRMICRDGRTYEGEWELSVTSGPAWSGYGVAVYPGDGFEVRVEGGFRSGRPGSGGSELKVSVRLAGEREFRLLCTSPADDTHLPGRDGRGHCHITFRDGTVYDGIVDGLAPYRGRLFAPDGRECSVDKIPGNGFGLQNVSMQDMQQAQELVLRCLDELWKVFRPVMEANSETWKDFCQAAFRSVSGDLPTARGEMDYPWGASLPRRALAACQMPPSQLRLLGEEEFRAVQKWFRNFCEGGKGNDLAALEELAKQPDSEAAAQTPPVKEEPAKEQPELSEEDKRILSGDVRSSREVMRYCDLLLQVNDPDRNEKMEQMLSRISELPL